jgi:hypothetical protein
MRRRRLARGTPLAIATKDGTLYFPADGNTQLKVLLNAHVRATGTVVEKSEPMELKMPVGEKDQMIVRIEGGYRQITIQAPEKIPPAKLCLRARSTLGAYRIPWETGLLIPSGYRKSGYS